MRLKIIAGNLIAVLIVGLGSYFVVRSSLEERLVREVDNRIVNDQVLFERSFLLSAIEFVRQVSEQAGSPTVKQVFGGLDEDSRRLRAYEACERISQWFNDPARGRVGAPDIVVITDGTGKVLARSQDKNRMYGQALGQSLPSLRSVLSGGSPTHDVWNYTDEAKLLQTAMAAVRGDTGTVLGAIVVGYDLSNGLAAREKAVLGRDVAIIANGSVYSSSFDGKRVNDLKAALNGPLKSATEGALSSGAASQPWEANFDGQEFIGVTARLPESPNMEVGYIVLGNRTAQLELADVANVILILMALGALGVSIYGFLVGTSFIRPVEQIEEDILAIINGNTELRIDVKSAEFGGLAYRVNQLVNVFTGVQEADEEGRVSAAPAAPDEDPGWEGAAFQEGGGASAGAAAAAGGSAAGASDVIDDPQLAARLETESEDAYYARIYREYVSAKKGIGEDVSSIPQDRFVQRIKGNAQALAQKHGCRAVRFQVDVRGNQVILRPVLIR